MVQTTVTLTFHNQKLRSYIEVDLCARCPRQDDKGCCGFYSPVFYPTDFVYLLENEPDLIDEIFAIHGITVLDASVTVNQRPDGDSYRCHFHRREGGCRLSQYLRESVCRHFVCPDIGWEKAPHLQHWKRFFAQLEEYEIKLNHRATEVLKKHGLSLRRPADRPQALTVLQEWFHQETQTLPGFFAELPAQETAQVLCQLRYGRDWTL